MKPISAAMFDLAPAPESAKAIEEKAETVFARMLVREVRKTMPDSFMGSGPAEMFSNVFDDMLAEQLVGQVSLGVGEALTNRMSEQPEIKPLKGMESDPRDTGDIPGDSS